MTWKPVAVNNAVYRVRFLIQFKNSLKLMDLESILGNTFENFRNLNFEQLIRAERAIQNLPVESKNGEPTNEGITEGWVINRGSTQNLIEEAGFRINVFGYMTTECENWNKFYERFWEIFNEPIDGALKLANIGSMRLEYWNKFVFDGNPLMADAKEVMVPFDPTFPDSVFLNNSLLHSHIGWFENIDEHLTLVQRNIDLRDEPINDKTQRTLDLFTLLELRQLPDDLNIDSFRGLMAKMNDRIANITSETLTESVRKGTGM